MKRQSATRISSEAIGLVYGFVGVFCFSLTLPATRAAVTELNPAFVGLGRALVASVLATIFLLIHRQPVPSRAQFKSLFRRP